MDLITNRAALRAYEPQWRHLAERRGNAFITPEWFWAWLDTYGESVEPAVLATSRENGGMLGLIPLVITTQGSPTTLRFAGAAHADHLHPACLEEDEQTIASAAAAALTDAGSDWTVAVLDNVDANAPWWRELARIPSIVGVAAYRDTVLPAIELGADGWEGYLGTRPRNFREQARRYPRRLERKHRVSYRRTTDQSELEADMATFFRLHDARWQERGGSSLASPRSRTFQLNFARSALRQSWLRLWFLEVDGVAVAAWYGWRLGDRYAYYQAGFDPAWGHLSVGFVLMVHTIRSAIEEGATQYDMLLGEESYKARFTNTGAPVRTVTLSRSWPSYLLTAAEARVWRASRRLPAGLRSLPRAVGGLLPTTRRR